MATADVFLDTNMLLHYQFPDQIDWVKVMGEEQVQVVLAPVVIRELDKHKDLHSSKRIRKRAGSVVTRLAAMMDAGNPSPLRSKVEISFLTNEPSIAFADFQLQQEVQDDRLIASILEHKQVHPNTRTVLATADLGLKIKARHQQIEMLTPLQEWKLPEEPDPDQEQIKSLQQELRQLKQTLPVLSLCFEDGADRINAAITPDTPLPMEEIEAQNEALKKELPLRRPPLSDPLSYPPNAAILSALASLGSTGPTLGDIKEYNAELEKYYRDHRQYLMEEARYQTRSERMLKLQLVLDNAGSAPGTDIDLFLHFPDGFELYREGKLPKAPKAPFPPETPEDRSKRRWQIDVPGFICPPLPRSPLVGPVGPPPNVSDPTIRRSKSYDVHWKVRSLKHGMLINLDPLFAVFESSSAMFSFTVDWRINAGNMPQEASGKLHIVVG